MMMGFTFLSTILPYAINVSVTIQSIEYFNDDLYEIMIYRNYADTSDSVNKAQDTNAHTHTHTRKHRRLSEIQTTINIRAPPKIVYIHKARS